MVSIPVNAEDLGLVVDFPLHPSLRPRALGRPATRDQFKALEDKAAELEDASEMYPPDECSLRAFKVSMEAALDATKNKSKAAKDKKREDRVVRQKDMSRQFKRAQRYLGLRPRSSSDGTIHSSTFHCSVNVLLTADRYCYPWLGQVVLANASKARCHPSPTLPL